MISFGASFFSLDGDTVKDIIGQGVEGESFNVGTPGRKNRTVADGDKRGVLGDNILNPIVDLFPFLRIALPVALGD